jgi:hypothetical protein
VATGIAWDDLVRLPWEVLATYTAVLDEQARAMRRAR